MELTAEQHTAILEWIRVSTQLRKNRADAQQKTLKEELSALVAQHKEQTGKIAQLNAHREAVEKQVRALSAQSTDLESEIREREDRMNDGTGLTSSDLVAIGTEIDGLKAKLQRTEDQHLAALQEEERLTSAIETATEEGHAIAARGKELQENRSRTAAKLDAEAKELSSQLSGLASNMGDFGAQVAQRAQDGPGAATLRAGSCGGCGAALSGTAIDGLSNSGPYAVAECEECESYVVKEG